MIIILAACVASYFCGAGLFIYDARQHCARANKAEQERDAVSRELRRQIAERGELHFHDGPILVTKCETDEQFIARMMEPARKASR